MHLALHDAAGVVLDGGVWFPVHDVQGVEDRGQGVAQLMGQDGQELVFFLIRLGQGLGPVAQLLLHLLLLGLIAHHLDEAPQRAAVVPQGGGDAAAEEVGAVLAHMPPIVARPALGEGRLEFLLGDSLLDVLRREEPDGFLAEDLGFLVTQEPLRTGIPTRHPLLGIEQDDGVVLDRLDEQAERLPRFDQRLKVGRPMRLGEVRGVLARVVAGGRFHPRGGNRSKQHALSLYDLGHGAAQNRTGR